MSDLDRQIEQLRRCELITEEEVKNICSKAREILVEESNTQRVDSPVTVRPMAAALALETGGGGGARARVWSSTDNISRAIVHTGQASVCIMARFPWLTHPVHPACRYAETSTVSSMISRSCSRYGCVRPHEGISPVCSLVKVRVLARLQIPLCMLRYPLCFGCVTHT